MSAEELAARLREAYCDAIESDVGVTVALCLFGIRYGDQILNSKVGIHRLCRMADIPVLSPTINLGINLGKHVTITDPP